MLKMAGCFSLAIISSAVQSEIVTEDNAMLLVGSATQIRKVGGRARSAWTTNRPTRYPRLRRMCRTAGSV